MLFMSYNVHSWEGTDGVKDYSRVLHFIKDTPAYAVALQEVIIPAPADNINEAHSFIEDCCGMHATFGKTMFKGDASYGNVLLTKPLPKKTILHDISINSREQRGVIEALIETEHGEITILATHLGLKKKERAEQAKMICDIYKTIKTPTVLMCDSNEWFPSKASKILDETAGKAKRVRSYPSYFPIFAIDQIRVKDVVADIKADRRADIKKYSDHLPVCAEITFKP
ncbi:MAG: hypothetical protein C0602_11780 [Denitrovibrio sp.]|nr:MAG: hypothetical protein C0602_11780 [Denitrovibrio sp.]